MMLTKDEWVAVMLDLGARDREAYRAVRSAAREMVARSDRRLVIPSKVS